MFWFSKHKSEDKPVTGLVLPGGGARNAYQVGVLKAIAELLPEDNDNAVCDNQVTSVARRK